MLKVWLRVGLVLIALLSGGIGYLQRETLFPAADETTASFTQIVTVELGNLNAVLSVVGELDAPQNQEMSFDRLDSTVTLLTLEVAAGQVVEAGQILATVDPTPYEQALEQARNDLEEAETALVDLQTPPTQLALAQAELAIAQADLTYEQVADALDNLLAPDLADLQSKVSDAQLKLTQAQSDLITEQNDTSADDNISRLKDTESELAGEYGRLTNESYSDAYYQDRVRLANNAWLAAQDTRITAEIQQQANLLSAQSSVTSAQQSLTAARQALADAQSGVDDLAIAKAQQAVAAAGVNLAQARADRAELDAGPDPVQLAAAQAAVTKAEQAVVEAEADLAGATLTAPFAGTVLQTNTSEGSRVTATSVILTLANLNQLQVVAAVDETTIRQVQVGQPVNISFDAFPGQTFSGQVLAVPLQGTLQGGVMVYDVTISLEGADELALRVGMTANAEISVGQAQNALLVPAMALQSSRIGYQVLLASPADPAAQPQAVPVEIGLSNGTFTEITSGLDVGDQVVVQMSASTDTNPFGQRGGGSINSATRLLNGR